MCERAEKSASGSASVSSIDGDGGRGDRGVLAGEGRRRREEEKLVVSPSSVPYEWWFEYSERGCEERCEDLVRGKMPFRRASQQSSSPTKMVSSQPPSASRSGSTSPRPISSTQPSTLTPPAPPSTESSALETAMECSELVEVPPRRTSHSRTPKRTSMARDLASRVRDWRTEEGMGRRAPMRDSKMARRREGVKSVGWSSEKGSERAARRALRDGRSVGISGRGESVDIV